MPPSSTSRTPTSCIEQPNSNATIRSGFFFFLRGPRPQGLDYDSIKIKIQNPELEIQNSKIKDQRSKIKIKSSEIKIQITISKIKNHKIPNPKFIIPNPKSKVKYQKSKSKYLLNRFCNCCLIHPSTHPTLPKFSGNERSNFAKGQHP